MNIIDKNKQGFEDCDALISWDRDFQYQGYSGFNYIIYILLDDRWTYQNKLSCINPPPLFPYQMSKWET